jgi:hypothetical protein
VFNSIESIFENKEAGLLFSKILKLERWSVILLFYFNLIKKDVLCGKRVLGDAKIYAVISNDKKTDGKLAVNNSVLSELDGKLYELIKEVWRNHNNLVNWIKQINKNYSLSWVLNDTNRIYYDVKLDKIRLVLEIKSCCMVVIGLINQM